MKNKINVVNIKCGGCERGITDALEKLGLTNIEVSYENQTVEFDGDKNVGIKELTKLGYPQADTQEAKSIFKNAKSYETCAVGSLKEGSEDKSKRGKKF